jgi:glycosyltransferase involved in cell wall biosynthesis
MNVSDAATTETGNSIAFVIRRIPHYRIPFYDLLIRENSNLRITVFHGTPERASGGSGLIYDAQFPFAVKLKSFGIGRFIVQLGLIRKGILSKYELVVFEGSIRLVSSVVVMLMRRLARKKNILWLKGWLNGSKKMSRIQYLIRKYYLSLSDAYIVYGHESKKLLEIYSIEDSRITIVQNTVDVDDLISKKHVSTSSGIGNESIRRILAAHAPYIFNLGRIVADKRVGDLICAYKELNCDATPLVIAGDGPDLKSLREMVNNLKISNVHLLGAISEVESKVLYANCCLCVFPGAVGLSLNEAMAAGKGVICADEKGPDSELLIHEDNGIRFEKGNIKQLGESMRYLMVNQEIRENLGKRALESIREKGTLHSMVCRFSSALIGQLSQKPGTLR